MLLLSWTNGSCSLTDNVMQVSVISAALFTAFSVGTALAPNLASFFVFRILTAFQGTAFLVVGSAVIGDIYKPVRSSPLPTMRSLLHQLHPSRNREPFR